MESQTPITDACRRSHPETGEPFAGEYSVTLLYDAARQLERDRADLIAALTYVVTRVTTRNVTESDLLREFRAQATAALAKVRP